MGLDGIEIVMEVEKDFGIKLADADAANVRTVDDLVNLAFANLMREPERLPDRLRHVVFLHLQTVLSEQMGVRRSKIKSKSRLVEDLGVT